MPVEPVPDPEPAAEQEAAPAPPPPPVPLTTVLDNSYIAYERHPAAPGAMFLHFYPMTRDGKVAPQRFTISFDAAGWARFQGEVARDGARTPLVTAPASALRDLGPGPGKDGHG